MPVTVVEDTAERAMLLRREGTPMKMPRRSSMTELFQSVADGTYDVVDAAWKHTNALEIAPVGRAHSIWPMWVAGTWDFACWYVNLQEPMRRSRLGWDTFDHSLDIVVNADRTWAWKDEDHLAMLQDFGVLTGDAASEVRREGERVIADLEHERFPFDRDWSGWRPDPAWVRPTMPSDWSVV